MANGSYPRNLSCRWGFRAQPSESSHFAGTTTVFQVSMRLPPEPCSDLIQFKSGK